MEKIRWPTPWNPASAPRRRIYACRRWLEAGAQFFAHRDRTRFVLRVEPAARVWTSFDGHEVDEAAWRRSVADEDRGLASRPPREPLGGHLKRRREATAAVR